MSDGGLITAALEMAFAGNQGLNPNPNPNANPNMGYKASRSTCPAQRAITRLPLYTDPYTDPYTEPYADSIGVM